MQRSFNLAGHTSRLESGMSYSEAITALNHSSLAHSDWNIEHWHSAMLETAMQIARKWKKQV